METVSCVILGGGGHARVLIETIKTAGIAKLVGIIDADPLLHGHAVDGVPVLGGDELLPSLFVRGTATHFMIGVGSVGNRSARAALFQLARAHGLKPFIAAHASATVSPKALLGDGTMVFPGAIINPGAETGQNVIINTRAVVEHECQVGNHSHVAPGAVLCGAVVVGQNTHIGAGAVVKEGIVIGSNVMVGAGAVVIHNIADGMVVAGCPAKSLLV